MKRSILMAVFMSAALIFFGCNKSEMEDVYPESELADQEMAALKGAKAGKVFTGICENVLTTAEVNQWYDETNNWRTTGYSFWVAPDPTVMAGTAELYVDDPRIDDRDAPPIGKWEMTYEGSITPLEDGSGLFLTGVAVGIGVEGKVKGMEATWTYTMNYVGNDFPNPDNPTFVYEVEGEITKMGNRKQRWGHR